MCSFPDRLLEENERLRGDLLIAQRELQLLESLASENSRLRDLREATQVINDEVIPAEIINVSPDSNSKRVLVNKGSTDGVFVGQALLDSHGLMGQVDEVLPFTAWVLLITDSRHVTPVEVNRNGERALARGSRTSSTGLELEFVTQTQDMQAGDMLVSSGMGQVYPKNYPVARITSITKDPGQILRGSWHSLSLSWPALDMSCWSSRTMRPSCLNSDLSRFRRRSRRGGSQLC